MWTINKHIFMYLVRYMCGRLFVRFRYGNAIFCEMSKTALVTPLVVRGIIAVYLFSLVFSSVFVTGSYQAIFHHPSLAPYCKHSPYTFKLNET
jgi:hypothetical protein